MFTYSRSIPEAAGYSKLGTLRYGFQLFNDYSQSNKPQNSLSTNHSLIIMSPSSERSTINKAICNDRCCYCCCKRSSGSLWQGNTGQQQKDSAKTRLPVVHSGENNLI